MITRQDYMNDSKNLHQKYYAEIADEIPIKFSSKQVEIFKEKLKTDQHLNNIPLKWWDQQVLSMMGFDGQKVRQALKDRNDSYSMATGVCILKAAARQAVEEVFQVEYTDEMFIEDMKAAGL